MFIDTYLHQAGRKRREKEHPNLHDGLFGLKQSMMEDPCWNGASATLRATRVLDFLANPRHMAGLELQHNLSELNAGGG